MFVYINKVSNINMRLKILLQINFKIVLCRVEFDPRYLSLNRMNQDQVKYWTFLTN